MFVLDLQEHAPILILVLLEENPDANVLLMLRRLATATNKPTSLVVASCATPVSIRGLLALQSDVKLIVSLGTEAQDLVLRSKVAVPSSTVRTLAGPSPKCLMEDANVKREFWVQLKKEITI